MGAGIGATVQARAGVSATSTTSGTSTLKTREGTEPVCGSEASAGTTSTSSSDDDACGSAETGAVGRPAPRTSPRSLVRSSSSRSEARWERTAATREVASDATSAAAGMAIHTHAMEVAAMTMPSTTVASAHTPVTTMRRRPAALSAARRAARRARSFAISRTALLLRRSITGRVRPVVPWCMLPPLINAPRARMVPLAWSHVSNSGSFVWIMRSLGEKRSISRD